MSPAAVGLAEALRAWTTLLGEAHVVTEPAALWQAGTATFRTSSRVHAILRPASREQVQACVHIANQFRVPLYPVSSGKNWGYGSRVPPRDGVLLDLGRLDRIRAFNEELAYVTLEPGVTQRQLYVYLQERGSRLWMDATGASPDCSVVGNTLERGFGHTPMGDHHSNACGFEVVLPTGDCVSTGFGRFVGSPAGPLSRAGVGPALDGLFSQSNLGIVTSMTVWLMPAPEHFEAFFFLCDRDEDLPRVVEALRPLRLDGTLRSVMHIGNDYKVLAASGAMPWEAADDRGVLGPSAMAALRKQLGIGAWNGSGGLYGTRVQVREARRRLRRALAGRVSKLQFVDDRLLRILRRFRKPLSWLTGRDIGRMVEVATPVYNLIRGVPTASTLASVYWRKRNASAMTGDPDGDGCGLLWCSPVVPATGAHVSAVSGLASEILLRHGFEPQMSISLATERLSICVITIGYDRAEPGADESAMRCHHELSERLLAQGYPPYRLGVASMAAMDEAPTYAALLRTLKDAMDPNGVLAPGRYEPKSGLARDKVTAGVA